MTTQEIASRLVELSRAGNAEQAYKELFAENALNVEPPKWNVPDTKGLDALIEKSNKWDADVLEVHDSSVSDPIIAGNHFAVTMMVDITTKERGRSKMEEICVYEVENGKIVKEQFFH